MANPQIIPKRSTVAGKTPTTSDLALGEICLNHADRRLYSRHPGTGEVYSLARPRDPSDYLFLHAADGTTLYIGRLPWTDYPPTGPAEDATTWTIYKITTSTAGAVTAESSATGAWSNKENLSYS